MFETGHRLGANCYRNLIFSVSVCWHRGHSKCRSSCPGTISGSM
jgi:hypothetical protein